MGQAQGQADKVEQARKSGMNQNGSVCDDPASSMVNQWLSREIVASK